VKAPYTLLLVGETGVGKSSVFELIANVFAGNGVDHYNFDILDQTNERGGSNNQSQTNSARLYELTSKNGIVVSAGLHKRGWYA
jgi:predicted GTPase